jgi:hypothetical protein
MEEIDRRELIALLEKWRRGEINEREVHETAEEILERHGWHEYPESDPRSIAFEVVSHLDILNFQLICRDDIPEIIRFLKTAPGKETEAWERWKSYWDSIDYEERKLKLANNPYYAT